MRLLAGAEVDRRSLGVGERTDLRGQRGVTVNAYAFHRHARQRLDPMLQAGWQQIAGHAALRCKGLAALSRSDREPERRDGRRYRRSSNRILIAQLRWLLSG